MKTRKEIAIKSKEYFELKYVLDDDTDKCEKYFEVAVGNHLKSCENEGD